MIDQVRSYRAGGDPECGTITPPPAGNRRDGSPIQPSA